MAASPILVKEAFGVKVPRPRVLQYSPPLPFERDKAVSFDTSFSPVGIMADLASIPPAYGHKNLLKAWEHGEHARQQHSPRPGLPAVPSTHAPLKPIRRLDFGADRRRIGLLQVRVPSSSESSGYPAKRPFSPPMHLKHLFVMPHYSPELRAGDAPPSPRLYLPPPTPPQYGVPVSKRKHASQRMAIPHEGGSVGTTGMASAPLLTAHYTGNYTLSSSPSLPMLLPSGPRNAPSGNAASPPPPQVSSPYGGPELPRAAWSTGAVASTGRKLTPSSSLPALPQIHPRAHADPTQIRQDASSALGRPKLGKAREEATMMATEATAMTEADLAAISPRSRGDLAAIRLQAVRRGQVARRRAAVGTRATQQHLAAAAEKYDPNMGRLPNMGRPALWEARDSHSVDETSARHLAAIKLQAARRGHAQRCKLHAARPALHDAPVAAHASARHGAPTASVSVNVSVNPIGWVREMVAPFAWVVSDARIGRLEHMAAGGGLTVEERVELLEAARTMQAIQRNERTQAREHRHQPLGVPTAAHDGALLPDRRAKGGAHHGASKGAQHGAMKGRREVRRAVVGEPPLGAATGATTAEAAAAPKRAKGAKDDVAAAVAQDGAHEARVSKGAPKTAPKAASGAAPSAATAASRGAPKTAPRGASAATAKAAAMGAVLGADVSNEFASSLGRHFYAVSVDAVVAHAVHEVLDSVVSLGIDEHASAVAGAALAPSVAKPASKAAPKTAPSAAPSAAKPASHAAPKTAPRAAPSAAPSATPSAVPSAVPSAAPSAAKSEVEVAVEASAKAEQEAAEKATIAIQARVRSSFVANGYRNELKARRAAATIMQASYRGHTGRSAAAKQLRVEAHAAALMQALMRGRAERKSRAVQLCSQQAIAQGAAVAAAAVEAAVEAAAAVQAARDADAMMADAIRLVRFAITAAVAQVEAAAKVEAVAKVEATAKEVPQEAPLPTSPKAPLPTAHYDTIVADSLFNMVAAGSDTIPLAAMGDFLRGRGDVPTEVIENMVTSLDTDGNGVIDLDEWRAGWLLLAPKLGN